MRTDRPPTTNIILGTMTLSYQGYGSRVHDTLARYLRGTLPN
jgi:hypothetical protein